MFSTSLWRYDALMLCSFIHYRGPGIGLSVVHVDRGVMPDLFFIRVNDEATVVDPSCFHGYLWDLRKKRWEFLLIKTAVPKTLRYQQFTKLLITDWCMTLLIRIVCKLITAVNDPKSLLLNPFVVDCETIRHHTDSRNPRHFREVYKGTGPSRQRQQVE